MSDTMYLLACVMSGINIGIYAGLIVATYQRRNDFIRDLLGMDFLDNDIKKKVDEMCCGLDNTYMKIYGVGFLCAAFICMSIWR